MIIHSPPSPGIPEIRLAPPDNDDHWLTVTNNARLAPPSLFSENETFISARQSFDVGQIDIPTSVGLAQVLFPTLQEWTQKSFWSRLVALAAAPFVFIFTVTLPVAEMDEIKVDEVEDEDGLKTTLNVDTKQGWNKQLLLVQCLMSPLFIFSIFALNGFISLSMVSLGLVVGAMLACAVHKFTSKHEPPSWFWMLSFVGFFVALNWIFLLANEVVGLLQALGQIFSISEAIMGLTVFALGNSIGDFVANTAIAKMGFPTMAISACYAGPLLNMVLGVGVSSFYQTWKSGTYYQLDIAPTILVSAGGLITVLLSTIVVVNINGFQVTKKLGWWMIIVYCTCCITNFLLEFGVIL